MLIGAMNHPAENPISEIRWMADLKLEFIDLTLEPPGAASWRVNATEIRRALSDTGLAVIGHTAYYLPFANPFESIRCAAVDELKHCLDVFAEVGAKFMNLHPDRHAPMHNREFYIRRNLESLQELQKHSEQVGVGLMIENLPGDFNSDVQLGELLAPMPKLGLHLDIGHANLMVPWNTTGEILRTWGQRVRHVHLHHNRGGSADLHLPLGAGNIDVRWALGELIKCGFDSTITLEVFTADRHFLGYSRDVLRTTWNELRAETSDEEHRLQHA